MEDLMRLQQMIDRLKSTSASSEKQQILAQYGDLKNHLFYTYNPFYQFYVTRDNVEKQLKNAQPSLTAKRYSNIFELLEALRLREITGNAAIEDVVQFIVKNKNHKNAILSMLGKDLKCKIAAKQINNVFPHLIPQFNVALASNYEEYKDKVDFKRDKWWVSRKLDGVRLLMVIDDEQKITAYSRNGNEYFTVEKVKEAIRKHFPTLKNTVFDGELCVVDDNGDEHFEDVVKLVGRKDYTIEHPMYKVFDMLTTDEFFSATSTRKLSDRLLDAEMQFHQFTSPYIALLGQVPIRSAEEVDSLMQHVSENGWEGLILRKDTTYKGKRSSDLLKVKNFLDAEYVVTNVVMGPFSYTNNGKEVVEEMLCSVKIMHKGNEVGVGSGFTLQQRKEYFAHPERIKGKTIKVKYFAESTDTKSGLMSLRFPVVLHVYDDKRFD